MGKRTIIYGVATNSPGKYSSRDGSKRTRVYQCWLGMIARCYSEKNLENSPSYRGCTVCAEWLEFKNFAEWFNSNYIKGFALDKDIIKPGNRIYCPEYCGFVPTAINTMLTHASRKHTRYDLPSGVSFCTFTNRYIVVMRANGRSKTVGRFDDPDIARREYIRNKKIEVVRQANKYRGQITEQMYQALLVFPVDMEK